MSDGWKPSFWAALDPAPETGLRRYAAGRKAIRRGLLAGMAACSLLRGPLPARAQEVRIQEVRTQEAADPRPLPEVISLMHAVEEQQRAAEAKEKDYIYRESERVEQMDGHGGVKKVETREYDIFWLNGVVVRKLVKQDGKELSAEEQAKESERIDKEVARARERRTKLEGEGKATDPNGNEEITVSRMLELGSFGNARRTLVHGRPTILVDFAGDPKAKTRNPAENAMREMGGTVWVDEQDRAIEHLEGRFVNNFKLGGGLLVNVKKDTSFELTQVKVNDEVWLPQEGTVTGQARVLLLFSVNGRFQIHDGDYRRFKATSTILPGVTADEASPAPASPASSPPQ